MRTGPDTLTGQIRAILRASASASAPISAAEIRAQLIAADVEDDDSVYRRLSCMLNRGEVVATGEKPGKRYHMADAYTPAPRSPRNKPADGPSLTQRVLDIVTAQPGVMFAQLRDQLLAQGVALHEGQPSTCLSRLCKTGQMRSEGPQQQRRYYIHDAPRPAATPKPRKTSAAPATVAEITPTMPPLVDTATAAPDDGATTSRPDWHQSDDPITRLAASIEDHLTASAQWATVMQIAEELDEDPEECSMAARRLVQAKRAEHIVTDGVRHYGVGTGTPGPAVATITLGEVLRAHAQVSMPPSSPEITPGSAPDAAEGATVAPFTRKTPPPAYCPAEVRFTPDLDAIAAAQTPEQRGVVRKINDLLDFNDAALSEAPLLDSAQWLRGDIEDLVGRACDRRAEHGAIKALTTAAFAMARAIQHLHTADIKSALTGVPQS